MIKLQKPLKTFQAQFITNSSYSNYRKDIWPRSSMVVELRSSLRQHQLMVFVTRDMRFIGYNMTAMMDSGKIEKLYDRQLNKTYENANCRDILHLKQSRPYDYQFVFFCHYYRPKPDNPNVLEGFLVVIYINKNYLDVDPEHPKAVIEYVVSEFKALNH